jgi:hypothetical protein
MFIDTFEYLNKLCVFITEERQIEYYSFNDDIRVHPRSNMSDDGNTNRIVSYL